MTYEERIGLSIEDYKELSEVTLSENFNLSDPEVQYAFARIVADYGDVVQRMDMLKKVIFYNREKELLSAVDRAPYAGGSLLFSEVSLDNQKLLHGAIGIATESGELLDAVYSAAAGKREMDKVNIREELFDIMWYFAIFLRVLRINFYAGLKNNIDKLYVRFKGKFTALAAKDRDLDSERRVLEQ